MWVGARARTSVGARARVGAGARARARVGAKALHLDWLVVLLSYSLFCLSYVLQFISIAFFLFKSNLPNASLLTVYLLLLTIKLTTFGWFSYQNLVIFYFKSTVSLTSVSRKITSLH